jgi:hypothetical protein
VHFAHDVLVVIITAKENNQIHSTWFDPQSTLKK